ncbi:MAG: hypothetical protein R3B45_04840 [Bdellovibrionota bacterium]
MLGSAGEKVKFALALALIIFLLIQMVSLQIDRGKVESLLGKSIISIAYMDKLLGVHCRHPQDDDFNKNFSFFSLERPDPSGLALLAWLVSPGTSLSYALFCENGHYSSDKNMAWGYYVMLLTLLLLVLCARFLTGSWVISLFVGCFVITREELIARFAILDADPILMMAFSLWFASTVHFLKTGAVVSFLVSACAILLGVAFDYAFGGFVLGLPIFVLVGFFFRQQQAKAIRIRLKSKKSLKDPHSKLLRSGIQEEKAGKRFFATLKWMLGRGVPATPQVDLRRNIERGSLFRAINVPFGYWIYRKSRWKKLLFANAVVVFIVILFALGLFHFSAWRFSDGKVPNFFSMTFDIVDLKWMSFWFFELIEPFDIFYIISLAVILVCAMQSPADGLLSFFESIWLLIISAVLTLSISFVFDMIDYYLLNRYNSLPLVSSVQLLSRNFFLWIEPVVLMLGISGGYNLIKVADSRLGYRKF